MISRCGKNCRARFAAGSTKGGVPETPKAGDAAFANSYFQVMLGLDDLFHPAHGAAEAAGCLTCCDNCADDWPVEHAAEYLLVEACGIARYNPGGAWR